MLAVAAACGDDGPNGSTSTSTGGTGGSGSAGGDGAGGAPVACHSGGLDDYIKELVGKPCSEEAEVCESNNGCGGCSVTCTDGVWTSTNGNLSCPDIEPSSPEFGALLRFLNEHGKSGAESRMRFTTYPE